MRNELQRTIGHRALIYVARHVAACIKAIRICSAASGTPATTARTATRTASRAHQALDIKYPTSRIEYCVARNSMRRSRDCECPEQEINVSFLKAIDLEL